MNNLNKYNFKNKKALVRVDFNVPLNKSLAVTDNTRIKRALPTIKKILKDGGAVVLMSHLGRPKGQRSDEFSLQSVSDELCRLLNKPVKFYSDCKGLIVQEVISEMKKGEIFLLENLRFYPEEKNGNPGFAQELAELGCDVYVNDAFGTAHRAHASTAVIADYFDKKDVLPGLLMNAEVENAHNVLANKKKPFTAILGGAKVSDKILLIENLLDKADNILIGGAMAYTFIKALGGKVGKSLVEDDKLELAKKLIKKAKKNKVNLMLPVDTVIADDFNRNANSKTVKSDKVPNAWMGLDIGPETWTAYAEIIKNSKVILWNGPMGVFEFDKFSKGTENIALAVGEASKTNKAFSLVGGGDSVAAVNKLGLAETVSYVSTGGGALLELFEGKELPGVKALSSSKKSSSRKSSSTKVSSKKAAAPKTSLKEKSSPEKSSKKESSPKTSSKKESSKKGKKDSGILSGILKKLF